MCFGLYGIPCAKRNLYNLLAIERRAQLLWNLASKIQNAISGILEWSCHGCLLHVLLYPYSVHIASKEGRNSAISVIYPEMVTPTGIEPVLQP